MNKQPIIAEHERTPKKALRWNRTALVAAALLLAAIGWVFWETWTVHRSTVNLQHDYETEYRLRTLDGLRIDAAQSDAAWRVLVEMTTQHQEFSMRLHREAEDEWKERGYDGEADYFEPKTLLAGPLDPALDNRTTRGLEELRRTGCFELLDEFAGSGPGLRPVDRSAPNFINRSMPELALLRSIAKARILDMRYAAEAGDRSAAMDAFADVVGAGKSMTHQMDMISRLVGLSLIALALNELRFQLLEHRYDEASARRLLGLVHMDGVASIEEVLEGERLFCLDVMEWMFNENGYLIMDEFAKSMQDGNDTSGLDTFWGAFKQRFGAVTKAEAVQLLNDSIDLHIAEAGRPYTERWATDYESWLQERLTWKLGDEMIDSLFCGTLWRAIDQWELTMDQVQTARLMIALEIARLRDGRYPDTLAALAPDILSEVPSDPICHQPYGYARHEKSGGASSYILYSCGRDCRDNGGRIDPDEPRLGYNTIYGDGLDVLYSNPRPPREAEGE